MRNAVAYFLYSKQRSAAEAARVAAVGAKHTVFQIAFDETEVDVNIQGGRVSLSQSSASSSKTRASFLSPFPVEI